MPTALDFSPIHPTWLDIVKTSLQSVEPGYLADLEADQTWLPGASMIFNAFSVPLTQTKVILVGESPYPRPQSANGYAFWDAAVGSLWSETGLSKPVNRATSLRNFIKMLMLAQGLVNASDLSQNAIACVKKDNIIQTAAELFGNMMTKGIVLLNASLVLSARPVQQDAKAWRGFLASLLSQIQLKNNNISLLLMGNISKVITQHPESASFDKVISEHPYNVSFINNPDILQFFRPLHLLQPLSLAAKSVTIS